MMRAIVQSRYGADDVLGIGDIDPPAIAKDDVLVRVHAAGLDPGVWHLMTGRPYLVRIMGFGLRRPKSSVPGMDLAGTVEAAGANVTRFQPGDAVFGAGQGAFAEYARAPADALVTKPAGLTFEQAAAVPTSALTALQGIRDVGAVKPGQSVLVVGASGGVGTFAVQIAKAFGAEVTGVCSTAKTELVRSIGADRVIDYTCEDFAEGDRRYDVVLDTGGNRPLSHLRRALSRRGTLVIVGGEGGGRWIGGTDRQLRALLVSPFVRHELRSFIARVKQEDLATLKDLIESGKLTPVLDRAFPLSRAGDAVRYWEQGHARGKVVIRVAET